MTIKRMCIFGHVFFAYASSFIRGAALKRGLILVSVLISSNVWAAPHVVVSIRPVHSLVSMVMQGVASPELLIKGAQSPHTSHLAPSSIQTLFQADLLVWIGPNFETNLSKQVSILPGSAQIVTLMQASVFELMGNRKPGEWSKNDGETILKSKPGSQESSVSGVEFDPHLWLSTHNAIAIVDLIAEKLAMLDSENAEQYTHNAAQAVEKINMLKRELDTVFESNSPANYLVYHDAFHYFEHEFMLNNRGALTLNPERSPGAKTLRVIRKSITDLGIKCIFHEPQFQPRIIRRLAETFEVSTAELDPLGLGFNEGPAQWFELMRMIKDQLLNCKA